MRPDDVRPDDMFGLPFKQYFRLATRAAAWAHEGGVSRQSFIELAGIIYDATSDVTREMFKDDDDKEANG